MFESSAWAHSVVISLSLRDVVWKAAIATIERRTP
jgi:hypothetical protein